MAGYTKKQKALVIELIRRNGGTISKDVIADSQKLLSAPVTEKTLHRWWKSYSGSEKDVSFVTVDKKKATDNQEWASRTLDSYFEKIAYTYLDRAVEPEAVKKTSGNQAVMTAAVAVDKMRLLRNLPTEIVSIMPDLMKSIEAAGENPYDLLMRLKQKLDNQNAKHVQ